MDNLNKYLERIGPVWAWDDEAQQFKMPERTLGWHAITWIMEHLTNGETGPNAGPFLLTPEQARFILWFYALDHEGNFLYNEGVIQRLKGWGKDPLNCVISSFEALGECRFDGWDDAFGWIPKVKKETLPLVQIAAVTQDQTSSTLRLYRHYMSKESMKKFQIEINTETVKSFGIPVIFAVTSNPEALEGKVSTFTMANETQHWIAEIAQEMWRVIVRNSVKTKGGTSRVLATTNAFDPNYFSIAQQTREAYENQMANLGSSKILYDSLEISSSAPLFIFDKDEAGNDSTIVNLEATRQNIGTLIDMARGDSKWHSLDRIIDEFFDVRYPVDLNRRFWLNTVVTSENAWIDLRDYDVCVKNTVNADIRLSKKDKIVLFFDGSKTDDSTVLMACRVSDGYIFKVNAWHKPPKGAGPAGTQWLVPRNAKDKRKFDFPGYANPYENLETVDEAVDRAFKKWTVVGFFADPSHAREDVDNKLYWNAAIEGWHIKYSSKLAVWAGSKTGLKSESIMWDMQDSSKIEEFASFAERTAEMVMNGELLIENDSDIRTHFKNARVYKTKSGLESIWKGKKNSNQKIDLAVGAIGALMIRSKYLKMFGQAKTSGRANRYL